MLDRKTYRETFSQLHASGDTVTEVLNMARKQELGYTKPRRASKKLVRTALIAAVCAMALTTTALAVALSRVDMVVQEHDIPATASDEASGFSYEARSNGGATQYDITFMPVDNEYIELGYWYPETLPEGFEETFVSDHYWQSQTVHYGNGTDDWITYMYGIAGDWFNITLEGNFDIRDVTVGSNQGKMFIGDPADYDGNQYTTIVWTDAERGLGFFLEYMGREQVDLATMAQSVTEQSEGHTSSWAQAQEEALEELGVYMPAFLPEGYELTETHAMPTSEGSGWYAYVRRIFENADHKQIYLGYETVGYSAEATEAEIAEMVFPEPGMQVSADTVTWYIEGVGPQLGLEFTMTADDLTADELLALAESVTLSE